MIKLLRTAGSYIAFTMCCLVLIIPYLVFSCVGVIGCVLSEAIDTGMDEWANELGIH